MNEPKLPAWQDVLGEAEQVVRQKPLWSKFIKGTPLENDVPVWMANFAQQAVMRDRARRLQDFSAAPSHDYVAGARYTRKPEADKRVSRGDDFAGDAWLDTETGETVYTVVGFDRNQQPTMIVQDGKAVSTSGVLACPECNGMGYMDGTGNTCPDCNGTGNAGVPGTFEGGGGQGKDKP